MIHPGVSLLVLGPPGSGKSSLARKALEHEGSGVVVLAPGLDEEASYRSLRGLPTYIVKGYDDPEFFPSAASLKATGYDQVLADLRAVYAKLSTTPEELRPRVLVTDTFNALSGLAMNKTFQKMNRSEPPPAMSPDGAAFWGYFRNLQESLMRICRAIRGSGLHWVATCHINEKEQKEFGTANPEAAGKMPGLVPAIQGGFRDVFGAGFDLVMYAGVEKLTTPGADPVHYLQWRPDPKRPTKSRYGKLATTGRITNDWKGLLAKIEAIDTDGAK